MSEENALNVEEDGPALVEAPAPEPEAPPEPVAPEIPDVDLNAVDVRDEQRVRGVIGELSRIRAENRTLKEQAGRLAQVEAELNQSRPYVEFLRANPHLTQPRQPDPVPAAPEADPDAVEAARLMDFYTADGKPDVDRGARWLALQDKRSNRAAQAQMQPLQQQSMQERAQANYAMLRNFTLPDGSKLQQTIVDGIWTATQREQNGLATLANPESVRALALLAIGAQSLGTRPQPSAPANPPLVTEATGGKGSLPAQRLSNLEERTITQRGMKPAAYQELTKNFKAGQSNVLEED